MKRQKQTWVIVDWAGNEINIPNEPSIFASFEDAEECLSEFLGDSYETDRQEYEIEVQS